VIVANDVPTTILHLDHVTKSYEPNLPPAVSGMTLTLRQGELLGLLGPSGCGKTTLLRLIAGFEQPQSGHIKLAGHHASGACGWIPPERRGIGMVFQDYALFPHLTLAQNVAFGLRRLAHLTPSEVDKRTQEAIGLVGLEGLAQRYPHQLSGGQPGWLSGAMGSPRDHLPTSRLPLRGGLCHPCQFLACPAPAPRMGNSHWLL